MAADVMPTGTARLRLAAAPQVAVAGRTVPLGLLDGVLLAWLALEGATPRQQLASLLWPDKPQAAARNALRQRLFRLRERAGLDLVAGVGTLALAPGVSHDLGESDGVLGDATLDTVPAGELARWVARQRERGRARRQATLIEAAERAERASDWDEALALAADLLALDPLSEPAHRRLMRLHYLRGDRAAALMAFDACERTLKDEVGAAPSPETLALLATIERSGSRPDLLPVPGLPASVLRPPRLVGRAHELGQLLGAVDSAAVVLLEGSAGQGKSRLLAEFSALVGVRAANTGARPGDAGVPYALAARLLRQLLARPGVVADAAWRADLARLLPELGTAPRLSRDEALARQAAAVEALVAQARQAGLAVVVLDDLHFADDASLELLDTVTGSAGCAWVLALRPHETSAAARVLRDHQAASSAAVRIQLGPLDAGAVQALLASLALPGLDGRDAAVALQRRSGGNPLYLLETLKALLAEGRGLPADERGWPSADGVQRLIQQRLARLSPMALKIARCAAVAGIDLSAELVAQVLGLRPLDLADAWAELEAAEVLAGDAFAHDLIADAALQSVPQAIAQPLHAEIAVWLDAHQGEPARVAVHWLAAGQPLRAAPALRAAARRATAALRQDEAAGLHDRAAQLYWAAGDRAGAFDAWVDAAVALTETAIDGRLRAWADRLDELAADDTQRVLAGLVRIAECAESRRLDEARSLAARVLPLAERCGRPELQGELHWSLCVLHWERRELADAAHHASRVLACTEGLDDRDTRIPVTGTRHKAIEALGLILASTGRYAEGLERLTQAHRLALDSGDRRHAGGLASTLVNVALEQGDLGLAQSWSRELGMLRELGSGDVYQALRHQTLALVALASGELGQALAAFDEAVEHVAGGYVRNRVYFERQQAWLWHELGRRDLALRRLDELARRPDLSPAEQMLVQATRLFAGMPADAAAVLEAAAACEDLVLRVRAITLAQRGCDPAQVLPLLTLSAATARDHGAHGLWVDLQARRIAALRALGRDDEAGELAPAVWARIEQGCVGFELFPRTAAELCAALMPHDETRARAIARRAADWIERAGATLPSPWREVFLRRYPLLPGEGLSRRLPS